MREWRYSRYAAFLSGSVFMFSGYIISVINLPASLASVIWLPLVILFYKRALTRDWVKNSIITGIFLTMMFLGGEPAILLATIFILILLGIDAADRFKAMFRIISVSLLVTAGLSCFQVLPFLELLQHTSRSTMGFREASMWSLPPYALLDLFVPYLSETDYLYKDYWTRQSWLLVYYMGIFSMICAFISLRFDRCSRRRAFFYILALGLVLSFGRYTPLYYFLYKVIPGFGLSRYPVKFFFMVTFSLAVLAGMGLDYYRRFVRFSTLRRDGSLEECLKLGRFLKALLAIACAASFLYLILNLNFSEFYRFLYNKALSVFSAFADKKAELAQFVFAGLYNLKRALGYFMFLALLMFLPSKTRVKLSLILPILLCVSFMDIFTANRHVYQNMDIGEYLKPGPSVEFLKSDKGLFRIFNSPATIKQNIFVPERGYFDGVRSLKERMVTNRNVSFGIYSVYGYGSLYNGRHEELVKAIAEGGSPDETNLLNLLNAKYIISPRVFEAKGYRMVKKGKRANIYENENVLPRAFLVGKVVVIKDKGEVLKRLKSRDFNPAKEVILEQDLSFTNGERRTTNGRETVNILKYSPGEVVIRANISAPRFLILSDSYYPGWKAYVDGSRTKIYRADYILRAVHLKPGRHIIKFTYDPFSFKMGAIITLLTAVIIAIFFKRRRRNRGPAEIGGHNTN